MQRFWIFPLTLGIAGALLPWLAIEGIIPFIPNIVRLGATLSPSLEEVVHSLLNSSGLGFAIGALLGLVAGVFDLVRKGRASHSGSRMAANIAWCLLHVHALIIGDLLFIYLWLVRTSNIVIGNYTTWIPAVLCLLAISWGAIRTVATNDVLTPRVLGAKLKRSTQIEG